LDDDIDQDAMAAEWEAAAAGEQPDFDSLGDDGDDLASEWEAMVDGDGETFLPAQQSSGPERILNQEEMEEDIRRDYRHRLEAGKPPHHAHEMGEDQWEYNNDLSRLIGLAPLPKAVELVYRGVHSDRVNNLQHYKDGQYEITGPESWRKLE